MDHAVSPHWPGVGRYIGLVDEVNGNSRFYIGKNDKAFKMQTGMGLQLKEAQDRRVYQDELDECNGLGEVSKSKFIKNFKYLPSTHWRLQNVFN